MVPNSSATDSRRRRLLPVLFGRKPRWINGSAGSPETAIAAVTTDAPGME